MGTFMDRLQKPGYRTREPEMDRERRYRAQKDDYLLRQIDEFKEKARQLQEIIDARQDRTEELEDALEEREGRVRHYQNMLDARQVESDRIAEEICDQIDDMIVRVDTQLKVMDETIGCEINTLNERISEQVSEFNNNSRQGMEELGQTIRGIPELIEGNSKQELEEICQELRELGQGVRELGQGVRELEQKLEEFPDALAQGSQEQAERLQETVAGLSGSLEAIRGEIADAPQADQSELAGQLSEIGEAVGKLPETTRKEISDKLDGVKTELSEKVHSENVKCYRNIQAAIEELEQRIETIEAGADSSKGMRGYFRAIAVLAVANLLGIAGIATYLISSF